MKHTNISPYKLLFCIVDSKISQKILDYLNQSNETIHYTCLAEGTRRLGILQMLGVGRIDRNVIMGIIRTSTSSQTLHNLDNILMPDADKSYGWAFTTRLSSTTSEVIEFINGERQASIELQQEKIQTENKKEQTEEKAETLEQTEIEERKEQEKVEALEQNEIEKTITQPTPTDTQSKTKQEVT